MRNIVQGQTVRITATFHDFNGNLVDPTTVNFFIQREADINWTEIASISPDSTGVYHTDVDTSTQSGVYAWRVIGTGTTEAANQGKFMVVPRFPSETAP